MKKLLLILPVLLLIGAGCSQTAPVQPSQSSTNQQGSASVKFVDADYSKFAYEINPSQLNNLSDQMKQVLSGFTVTANNNTDGTTTVNLTPTNTEYKQQSYTLKSGQKLYFIEKNLGDDQDGADKFYKDDTAVVVDQDGYVVQ